MNSVVKLVCALALTLAVSSKNIPKPLSVSDSQSYTGGNCRGEPEYPDNTDPCEKAHSLIGIGLGIDLGDLLDIGLDLNVGKCKKLLDLSTNVNALQNN
ncbi:hypothetical protein DSO57_1030489 [Entomophthora muscae]|uniref:Uncharacterized protein n=2 Tax=Entomophthora muscae TaxID=34485 RepID=A0ACC2T103_9FUNG|nr:hypothetical protein DSO57_1030488 [Entomophthora muscae]KAJ9068261.1 hypothetical protein DSO57_1030489 [Entomophthora muscae]